MKNFFIEKIEGTTEFSAYAPAKLLGQEIIELYNLDESDEVELIGDMTVRLIHDELSIEVYNLKASYGLSSVAVDLDSDLEAELGQALLDSKDFSDWAQELLEYQDDF